MAFEDTYFLGVDGGGTGCRAAIVRGSGAVIGKGSGGPANATTDADRAAANVMVAVEQAAGEAGLSPDALPDLRGHLGLAGIMNDRQATDFASRFPFSTAVSDDRPTSLRGALGDRDGVLAAVGTGSLLGVARDKDMAFMGGWGFKVGDQASGAWLGRALLEATLLAHDGLQQITPLIREILDHYDNDPNAIVIFARDAAPADFAQLAPQIVGAAEKRDPVGIDLMTRGANYLDQAFAVLDPDGTLLVCLTGGLGKRYVSWLPDGLADRLIAPQGTALDGALRLARTTP